MKDLSTLERVRAVCLALPEAEEKEAWGMPTFRVRGKLFAHFANDHHGDGRVALWLKAAEGAQELLVEAAPERFFVPPYMGPRGWVGMRVDGEVDWEEVAALVEEAWRLIAPKRVVAALDAAEG
ncbi:MAG: MmcQ/YjbR family DNA-binding protein [Dehalococcoidia bacterium]|nr:MmcQ/YjbR family DNA-binding protein [Dehalococcoidia bacterium]